MSLSRILVPVGLLVLTAYVFAAPVLLPRTSSDAQDISLQFPVSHDLQLGKLAVHSFRSSVADSSGRETLTLVRRVDAASPVVSRALDDRSVFPSATLVLTQPGIHPMLVTYALSDVVITSIRLSPTARSSRGEREEITLTFAGATMTRVPARPRTSDDCST